MFPTQNKGELDKLVKSVGIGWKAKKIFYFFFLTKTTNKSNIYL